VPHKGTGAARLTSITASSSLPTGGSPAETYKGVSRNAFGGARYSHAAPEGSREGNDESDAVEQTAMEGAGTTSKGLTKAANFRRK
jgi:hypothetical protein